MADVGVVGEQAVSGEAGAVEQHGSVVDGTVLIVELATSYQTQRLEELVVGSVMGGISTGLGVLSV